MGISHEHGTRYFVGDWKDEQFHPQVHERMSWQDNTYFAPESLEAPDGRRITWAWIFDQWDEATEKAAGWSASSPFRANCGCATICASACAPSRS